VWKERELQLGSLVLLTSAQLDERVVQHLLLNLTPLSDTLQLLLLFPTLSLSFPSPHLTNSTAPPSPWSTCTTRTFCTSPKTPTPSSDSRTSPKPSLSPALPTRSTSNVIQPSPPLLPPSLQRRHLRATRSRRDGERAGVSARCSRNEAAHSGSRPSRMGVGGGVLEGSLTCRCPRPW
jgi:hypothetical protein